MAPLECVLGDAQALFLLSLFFLQLSALSMIYGHNLLGDLDRVLLVCVVLLTLVFNVFYGRKARQRVVHVPECQHQHHHRAFVWLGPTGPLIRRQISHWTQWPAPSRCVVAVSLSPCVS